MPIVVPTRSCGLSIVLGGFDRIAMAATGESAAIIFTWPPWSSTATTELALTPKPISARPLATTCAVTPPPCPSVKSMSIPCLA